jgi:hypothetical protein
MNFGSKIPSDSVLLIKGHSSDILNSTEITSLSSESSFLLIMLHFVFNDNSLRNTTITKAGCADACIVLWDVRELFHWSTFYPGNNPFANFLLTISDRANSGSRYIEMRLA